MGIHWSNKWGVRDLNPRPTDYEFGDDDWE